MKERGSCHCGKVIIEVDFDDNAIPHQCTCSICAMKGTVMFDVPLDALKIVEGEEFLALYTFYTGAAKHRFCKMCGIHLYHQLRSDPTKYGVNGSCFAGRGRFDFGEMSVHDGGKAHPMDTGEGTKLAGTIRFHRH